MAFGLNSMAFGLNSMAFGLNSAGNTVVVTTDKSGRQRTWMALTWAFEKYVAYCDVIKFNEAWANSVTTKFRWPIDGH